MLLLSVNRVQLFCDPMDCSPSGCSVHGIPRQEYWTGLLFPSPGDLLHSGIKFMSPALAGGFFTTEPPGKPKLVTHWMLKRFSESEAVPLFRKW